MKFIDSDVLKIAYFDHGPVDGQPVVLLHGFPYDICAYDEVVNILTAAGMRCFVPYLRGYGPTCFLGDASPRSGEQAALGADLIAFINALGISSPIVAGYDWGGRAACVAAALWPERVHGLVSCGTGYNIQNIGSASQPANPEAEHRLWYQYYLHSERGYTALQNDRDEFCKYLWKTWSPSWSFTNEDFTRTARSFRNPDFVDVVTHSYRHRFGLVDSDPQYAAIESKLAVQPDIKVPAIVLQGADDAVTPPQPESQRPKFASSFTTVLLQGVGHNVPQEAPLEFAKAVLSLMRL